MPATQERTEAPRTELRLPPDVSAPAIARRAVHDVLAGAPISLRAQVSLVASELVTNVLRHSTAAQPTATLTLACDPNRVTLAVADAGIGFDPILVPREADGAVGGWGLRVLDAVANRWWVERDGGTRVVCEIDR